MVAVFYSLLLLEKFQLLVLAFAEENMCVAVNVIQIIPPVCLIALTSCMSFFHSFSALAVFSVLCADLKGRRVPGFDDDVLQWLAAAGVTPHSWGASPRHPRPQSADSWRFI